MSRFTVCGAALTCLYAAAVQGQQFDVVKLIRNVARTAESARQYEVEGGARAGFLFGVRSSFGT